MSTLVQLKKELKNLSDPEYVEILQRFFKTGRGEYGEGDIFLGLKSQQIRDVSKKYYDISLDDLNRLLSEKIHEFRVSALRILVYRYEGGDEKEKKKIYDFYLKNAKNINNWDLVDSSAPNIVGDYLLGKPRNILYKLAKSKNLWERRIAILATFAFIRNNEFKDTIKIAKILMNDEHDLIHKAVGWMLREVGKKDEKILEKFLDKYHKIMPRTMLRYAIEKLSEKKREFYLGK